MCSSSDPSKEEKGSGGCEESRRHWHEFCVGTPIHGVKYLVETSRPLYERLWWAAVLAVCFYYATDYSLKLWRKLWEDSNPTTTFVTRDEDVVDVPFPALTFCDNIMTTNQDNSSKEMTSFLCGEIIDSNKTNYLDVNQLLETSYPWAASCNMLHDYVQEGVVNWESDCGQMFTKTLSPHGPCYSFNMLDAKEIFRRGIISHYESHGRRSDWTPSKGYRLGTPIADPKGGSDPMNPKTGPYPKRAITWAIVFHFWPATESDGAFCFGDKPGIKVAVHSPLDFPAMGHRNNLWKSLKDDSTSSIKEGTFLDLETNNEYYIDADPEFFWTSKDLKAMAPGERRCYFQDEIQLKYFKHYSVANCENECLINKTIKQCGCVDFFMPRDNDTKPCPVNQIYCMMETLEEFKKNKKRLCRCQPPCKNLKYNLDFFLKQKVKESDRKQTNSSVILTVYISGETYTKREKLRAYRHYEFVDFLANFGGVFGLFCGMSIVSIIDFFYYATIRFFSNVKRNSKINEVNPEN